VKFDPQLPNCRAAIRLARMLSLSDTRGELAGHVGQAFFASVDLPLPTARAHSRGSEMTVPNFGRVTPLQMDMLQLGGETVLFGSTEAPSDLERMDAMEKARGLLRLRTGKDFGFDLAGWNYFLLRNDELSEEYTFHYAWKAVKRRIEELLDDAERLRLVRLIDERTIE
jgi:hypothetical protein